MDDTQHTSTWRDKYKVHPAADVFPMMTDEELAALGEDIKANRLKHPIIFQHTDGGELILLDGRNRLEAMERAGIGGGYIDKHYLQGDPVGHIIGLNIHRRHLTKQQQADLIVAAHKASRQVGEVPKKRHAKGKAGSEKDAVKAAAVADAAKHGIGKRTVERALAKGEGKTPATMPKYTARPMPKPKSGKPVVGIDAVRQCYLDRCAEPDIDLDAEQKIVFDALREIDGKRALSGGNSKGRVSALPQGGRSEDGSL